jgi:CheY-like chemotaxis protein
MTEPTTVDPCKLVLVVDDDAAIRESVVEILGDEGYDVREASNGQEALRRLRGEPAPPCLILLDLMMPIMDGFQFRSEQLADRALSDVPVVVMSADGNVSRKAASLSAAGALRKPLHLSELLQVVAEHCSGEAPRRAV